MLLTMTQTFPNSLDGFHKIVREERLFCTVLAHLLMQQGRNMEAFLKLINDRLPAVSVLTPTNLTDAQVYTEFTFLRDHWDSLGREEGATRQAINDTKRQTIFALLGGVDGLSHYRSEDFPESIPEFNARFMGPRGLLVANDIVYPGQWNVGVLATEFGARPEEFRNWCCFKWSFNIKPDILV
jgi:hypothetical protein